MLLTEATPIGCVLKIFSQPTFPSVEHLASVEMLGMWNNWPLQPRSGMMMRVLWSVWLPISSTWNRRRSSVICQFAEVLQELQGQSSINKDIEFLHYYFFHFFSDRNCTIFSSQCTSSDSPLIDSSAHFLLSPYSDSLSLLIASPR
jgi:hypothetical protein